MELRTGHFREAIDGDEADEVADVKRAPITFFKVEIVENGVIGFAFGVKPFWLFIRGDKIERERATCFADGKVFFPVGESDDAVTESLAQADEVPCSSDSIAPSEILRIHGVHVFVDDMRHKHDA